MIALENTNCRRCFYHLGYHLAHHLGKLFMLVLVAVIAPVKLCYAHASGQSFVMLLPTDIYILGGVIVVGLTIVLLAVMPVTGTSGLHHSLKLWRQFRMRWLTRYIHMAALLYFFWLLSAGWYGTTDPLRNPLTLGFWAVFWMGLVMVEGLFFSVWRWINPWVFAYHFLRWLTGWHGVRGWPSWLAHWPGVILLFGFAVFTLADQIGRAHV